MITFKIPGLPDESGRLSWEGLQVEYSRGKTLAQYLQLDLQLRPDQVSHVVVDGAIYRPEKTLEVRIRESRSEKFWRKFRGAPPPVETISEFDALLPPRGAEIAVVPIVAGKNTSLILGIVGAVIGVVLVASGVGAPAGAALIQAAMAGYAIGSTIGSLLTPAPKLRKEGDDGSSTYTFNGPRNDARAGMAQPVLLGEHLIGGMFIGGYRRREGQKERIYMLLSPSVGPVEGPRGITDPTAPANTTTNKPDFRINGQHYSNYEGVTVDWRNGDAGQTVIPGFNAVINTFPLSTIELSTVPYLYTTVSDKVDAFEVLLELPALVRLKSTGEIRNNTTRYKVRYRLASLPPDTGWVDLGTQTLTAQTRSKLLAQFRKEGLPQDRYQIELTFISADYTDVAKDAWKIYVTGITEETQDLRTYPGSALMAISGLGTEQLSGAWPLLTGVWRGIKVEPWNGASFDPLSWGRGTFSPVGQNPGWLCLQLLRNKIFGAGDEIPNADIDLASFRSLADWCAEAETVQPVSGAAYTEPKFQLDFYLDQQQPLLDLLNDVLGTCRASVVLSGNKWRAVMDRSATPVQLFNMGNIIQGSMQIQYRSDKARINAFDGQFIDRAKDYETDTVTVCIDKTGAFKTVDEMAALGITLRRRQSAMPGVTRLTQAVREIRFRLKSIYALRRIVGFGAFTDSILAEAGDVVNIAHDLPQWGYSGRVMDGSTASIIMFDREVPFSAGTTYQVACRFADGTAEAGEIRTVADTAPPADGSSYFGVQVTVPFSKVPAEGDLWVYGPVNTLTKPVRIVEISRDSDQQRMIIASDYNESIHATAGPIVIPTYSQLPIYNAPPPAIPEVKAFEETAARLDDRRPSVVVIQWTQPRAEAGKGLYKDAHLEWSLNNVNWESFGFYEREFRWIDAYQGETVYFRVTPRSTAGILNPTGAATTSLLISGHSIAPAQVASFTARAFEGQFIFEWPEGTKAVEYEVRDSNPANWKTDLTGFLWRGRGQKYVIEQPASRSKQLYLRTVDDFNNYAVAAVNATATDAAPAAPTITSIDRFKNTLKVKVSPPAALNPNDYIAIHLHASQTAGFVPDDTNRVAQTVGAAGGEFVYQVPSGGTPNWYFKATVEDWLSLRLGGWIYSAEVSAALVVITPALPTAVTQTKVATQRRVLSRRADDDYEPIEMPKCLVQWNHTDTAGNPSGALIGFEVILYTTDPQAPLEQTGIITKTAATSYSHLFDYLVFDTNTTVIAAVRAVYTDNINSAYVNSAGQVLGPTPETPLSVLVQDEFGRFELPDSASDYFPLDKSVFGVRGTRPLITPASVYALDGYGAVVERSLVEQAIDTLDLTTWSTWASPQTGPTVSVTKVTDGSVRPPVRGGWDVFKLTKITAAGEGYIFRSFAQNGGSVANRYFSGSAWVLNGRTEPLQFYPYLFTANASAGHQATMISAGAWAKIQTAPGAWIGSDTATLINLVIRSMSMNVGEFFYVAVPQLQTDIYFAHEPPLPPTGSVLQTAATGQLAYPPLSLASKSWTLFFKMKAKTQSVPKYIGNSSGYAIYMRTAGDLNVMGVYLSGLNAGGTRKLGVIATDGTSTFNPAEYTIPLAAYDDHVVAIKRNDTQIKVWLNGVLAISGTMSFDPTSGTRIIAKLFVGTHPGNADLEAMNAAFRNLAIFNLALTDEDIVAISKQGVRFVAPQPKIVVPRPLTVTVTEQDNL